MSVKRQPVLYQVSTEPNPTILHTRTKHIGIQAHFVREATQNGQVQVHYTPTQEQQADFLTKPLPFSKFSLDRYNAGIIELSTAT